MTARREDLEIEQGATFPISFVYKNEAGAPIDLLGYTAEFYVCDKLKGPVLGSATSANGRVQVNAGGVVGKIIAQIPSSETKQMKVDRGVYDFFLSGPGGEPRIKLLYGAVQITQSVR